MTGAYLVDLVKSFAALLAAFALTVGIGSFLGFPVDPDSLADTRHRLENFENGRTAIPSEEFDQFIAQLRAEKLANEHAPHPVVAIMKWHYILFGVFLTSMLLALRPSKGCATVVGLLTSGALFFVAGPLPASMPIAALAVLIAAQVIFFRPQRSEARA